MKTFSITLTSTLLLFAVFLLYDASIPAQFGKSANSFRNGREVIEQAIEQFQQIKTISADIVRLKCHFFGNEYSGSGYYLEKRLPAPRETTVSPNLFLLVLGSFQADSFSNSEHSSSTLKVTATGTDIWKFSSIEDERSVKRIDLTKLQDILAKSQRKNGSAGKPQSAGLGELTSLGGLEGTLIQIAKFYDFDSAVVESTQLGSEEKLAVWKVSAKLKPAPLKAMIASYGGDKVIAKHGGGHIPSAVSIYFGKEDFFPYRICYFGGVKENPFSDPPSVDLEYLKVSINGHDISNEMFEYRGTENVFVDDVSEIYAGRITDETGYFGTK